MSDYKICYVCELPTGGIGYKNRYLYGTPSELSRQRIIVCVICDDKAVKLYPKTGRLGLALLELKARIEEGLDDD